MSPAQTHTDSGATWASCVPQRPLVAILGGSFDPITDAHLKTACEIIHSKAADKASRWRIPCWRPGPAPLLLSRPVRPSASTVLVPCALRALAPASGGQGQPHLVASSEGRRA